MKNISTWIHKKLLPSNPFVRGVSLLAFGTAGSQVLLMLFAPVLTRLYTPAQFGLLAVYTGLLSLFLSVSTLSYEEAIPLPKSDIEGANVAALCMVLALLTSLACAAIIFMVGAPVVRTLGASMLDRYMWLLPWGLMLCSTSQILCFLAMRQKNFSIVARTRMKQSFATAATQLAAYKLSLLALILGHTIGQATGVASLAMNAGRSEGFHEISLAGMLKAARRYRNFPLFSTWSNLLDTASRELPPVLLALLFSPTAAGLYALANRVLAVPMTVLGSAIAHVLLVNAAQARRENRLGTMVAAVYDKLSHIAMPFAMILILAAPDLFSLVFGQQWSQAGILVQWMTPWLYVRFIASPLSTLIPVLEIQRKGLFFYTISFIVRISAILVGSMGHDLVFTVALFSVGSALCWGGYLIWITRLVGNHVSTLIAPTLHALCWSILCMSPLIAGKLYAPDVAILLAAAVASAALIGTRFYFLLRKAY